MFPAVNGSEDDGIRVKVMTVEFPAIGQLKDSLADFQRSTINLVEEQADRLFASLLEPIRGVEAGAIAFDAGQADKVAFRHLAGTAFNDRQAGSGCQLVDNLGLANTVATTEQDGQAGSANCWGEPYECFEVN
jgi:hypothetical protein